MKAKLLDFLFPDRFKPIPWKEFRIQYCLLILLGSAVLFLLFANNYWISWDSWPQSVKTFGFHWTWDRVAWCLDKNIETLTGNEFVNFIINFLIKPLFELIFLVLTFFIVKTRKGMFSMSETSWRSIFTHAFLTATALVSISYLVEWIGLYGGDPIGWNKKHAFGISFLATSVIGPVFEDTLFRFGLFQALRTKCSFFWAAFLSGVLFGLMHSGYPELIKILMCTGAGFLFAWLYERTGSILTPILTHMLGNSFNAIVAKFFIH